MSKKKTNPKLGRTEPYNSIRKAEVVDAYKQQQVCFLFSTFDLDGPWGISAIKEHDWIDLFKKIEGYQTMLWKDMIDGHGKPNHEIKTEHLSKKAQTRINELDLDADTIFSMHITGKVRLYGVRDRRECKLLWFDPWHDIQDKAVCPSNKRHT